MLSLISTKSCSRAWKLLKGIMSGLMRFLRKGKLMSLRAKKRKMPGARCNVEACKGKAFTKPFALLRHWAEIHKKKVTLYECSGCTKVFRQKTDVKCHALQKHQSKMQAIAINCQNKYYVAPGPTQPPTGYKTRDVPDAPPSQMAFGPKETPVR